MIPLNTRSVYSFLDSTLTPEALVELAARYEIPAIGLADTGNLHGAVPFAQAAEKAGIRPLIGAGIQLDHAPLLLYPENAAGYRNLCHILSDQTSSTERESRNQTPPALSQRRRRPLSAIAPFADHLLAITSPAALQKHPVLSDLFSRRLYLSATPGPTPSARVHGIPAIACPRIHYAAPSRAERMRYDIVQSIRTLTLLRQEHPEKNLRAACHFRPPAELARIFHSDPDALKTTRDFADRCHFHLPFGPPQFPSFHPPDGSSGRVFLRRLVIEGIRRRYPPADWKTREAQINEELGIIAAVGYEDYFLVVWDLLQTCSARGIGWITRGSAADSLVCYCLGISGVCPVRFKLHFRRFLNLERMSLNKLPDIDIDFAHDKKDEVVAILFEKHGPEHCAVVGGFSTFQTRSAFAEVAKVLGVAEREIRRFTEHFPWSFGGGWVPETIDPAHGSALLEKLKASPECGDLPLEEEPFHTALLTAEFLDGVPRYPKTHPCGVVLSRDPISALSPVFTSGKGWRTTHFDMEAVEAIGLVKLDILAQGGLATMRDTLERVPFSLSPSAAAVPESATLSLTHGPLAPMDALAPWEDPAVWKLIAEGGARGVHHIESPAMVSLCRMTNVREIDGLVAIVSVIRPGAANENKKLAFTRRYQDMEPVTFPDPSLAECLSDSYGLVVYEEHILQICENFAGLSSGRADVLRRALNKHKRAVIEEIRLEFFDAALSRGHAQEKTQEVWALASGFAGYAFCKAHSAAYGVEAYQAAWLKTYYPAEFMASVLTHGKGFYHPLVYTLECRRLGMTFLAPSVNEPGPEFTVHRGEPEQARPALRVPLTRMKGLSELAAGRIRRERSLRPFDSLADFFTRVLPQLEEMEAISQSGALDEFGQSRTSQFWEIQSLAHAWSGQRAAHHAPEGDAATQPWLIPPAIARRPAGRLEEPSRIERLRLETELFEFAITGHPLEMFPDIDWSRYVPVSELGNHLRRRVRVCGLIVEQRVHHQITGEPMKFLTLADWTGMVETELFAKSYRSYGLATVRYPVLEIEASVEPYENGRGFSLRIFRAGAPRKITA